MNPIQLNKTSSKGGTMDCIFRAWQHQSIFKKSIVRLFSLFHLGNCVLSIDITQTYSPLTVKFEVCLVLPCGDPQRQRQLQAKIIYVYSHPGPGEDYHDDFDKNLDGPCGGWSNMGWTIQYNGWTPSASGKGKLKQLQSKF
jgi:hypothetical protein